MTQVQSPVRDDMGPAHGARCPGLRRARVVADSGQTGVFSKIRWRSGDVAIGLIRVDVGAEKAAHVHHGAHHHIWGVSGSAMMVGKELAVGSYVDIPPGVVHEVTAVGAGGITFSTPSAPSRCGAANRSWSATRPARGSA